MALVVKDPAASVGATGEGVRSLGWEDPLEEKMATHSSILAGIIFHPWGERVGHD